MPSESSHIDVANCNQATVKFLVLNDFAAHLPWIGTIAFYKALHVVEAVLANSFSSHPTTHYSRNHFLATENRLKKIYTHYIPLYAMSQKARYLSHCSERSGVVRFIDHIDQKAMSKVYLLHHLFQLEDSAQLFLSKSHGLDPISDLKPILP